MRLFPLLSCALPLLLLAAACNAPAKSVERPKRVPTPGQANLPPTPALNPPQAPERYPDGAWSVRGLLTADRAALTKPDPATTPGGDPQPKILQIRGIVATLHPCPLTEKVCRPAPYLELSDNKSGQGRRLLVGGERDLESRHWTVGAEVTVAGRFATASPDGTYFAPDGLVLLEPPPPPPGADASSGPDAR